MEYVKVKEALKDQRKNAGLKIPELAKKSGVSQRTIYHIETGTLEPKIETLQKIAKALNLKIEKNIYYSIKSI